MKKILLLFLSLGLLSACSLNDDDAPDTLYDYAPISEVVLPETFEIGQTYDITVTYTLPSECQRLFGYEYVPNQDTHHFAIVTSYIPNNPSCNETPGATDEYVWKFTVNSMEKHIFKFWNGIDDSGTPLYLTREVEVTEPNT